MVSAVPVRSTPFLVVGVFLLAAILLFVQGERLAPFCLLFGVFCLVVEWLSPTRLLAGLGGAATAVGVLLGFGDDLAPAWRTIAGELTVVVAVVGAGCGVVCSLWLFREQGPNREGHDGMLGRHGEALSIVAEEGKVFVNGEIWQARAARGIIEPGVLVEVIRIDDMVLVVDQVADQSR